MPTARELLEQADALMRRNRANTLDDIPVLMDAVPAAAAVATRPPAVPLADRGPPSVPLLTENIDVIDEEVTLEAEAVEGEPSAWLEFEDANPSVIGDAPDSIAIVPPLERQATPPDEALLASAEHEEIEFTLPVEEPAAAEVSVEFAAEQLVENPVVTALTDAPVGAIDEPVDEPVYEAVDGAVDEPVYEAVDEAPDEAVEHAAAFADLEPHAIGRVEAQVAQFIVAPAITSPLFTEPSSPPLPAIPAIPIAAAGLAGAEPAMAAIAAPAPPPAPAPVALAMADDEERWAAAAEEIRMQVLQRIDLFTDTGLRDQLAQRLQPIADRASADFVKAINLHVGDLLRTYVAEAIEREIERWRRDH